jgi:ATP-binding cassette, subfamily B, bacterial
VTLHSALRSTRSQRGPTLFHAAKLAGKFVWNAARKTFALSIGAEALAAVGLAGTLLFGQQIIEDLTATPPPTDPQTLIPATVGLGISLAVSGVAGVFVRRFRWLVAEQVTRQVESEIVEISTSVDYEFYERQDFHDQLNRSNSQVAESSYRLAYDLLGVFNLLATTVVVVYILARSVPEVLWVVILIAIPSIAAARFSARLAFQATYELTPDDRLRTYLYRSLLGKAEAREMRVFALSGALRARWDGLYEGRMSRIRALVRRQVVFDGIATLIAASLVALVLAVLVGATVRGQVTVADSAVAIVALQQLASHLRAASATSGSLRQASLFLDDFESFRAMKERATSDHVANPSPMPMGRLVLDHVTFGYPGTRKIVLEDVSLYVDPGEIVALVGLSGGGKSTIAHLVAGLYTPTTGSITYGGLDVASMHKSEYWRSVAPVFQDFVKYELTARENIAISEIDRIEDLEKVRSAAERAGINDAMENLPAGYETMLSRSYDGGADLSIGQWQRLAVARAFFREAPLLILDEPAAALDAVAEDNLYRRLEELCDSRSVLLVSHRFSTVRMADRIYVVEAGRIVESGSHSDLMAEEGRYSELFRLQAHNYQLDPRDTSGLADT